MHRLLATAFVLSALALGACAPDDSDPGDSGGLAPFPAGYIDSPFVVPDGSSLYFIHSVVSTYDILTANPDAKPVTAHLSGHQGADGPYWWNTDIYMSTRNPDGTWGEPVNLGPTINTVNMESGPWTNDDQTVLIFTRESVGDPALSGSFIAYRDSADDAWGEPTRLPDDLGDYGATGYTDFELLPSGELYFWGPTPEGGGDLFYAVSTGSGEWASPVPFPSAFNTAEDEAQPWVNDDETVLLFNRRTEDGDTTLWRSTRPDASVAWGVPEKVALTDFADPNGYSVWGEPSLLSDGTLFFMRFDTSVEGWLAEILSAPLNDDGSYGPPKPIAFEIGKNDPT
jgi:hypothetical protein